MVFVGFGANNLCKKLTEEEIVEVLAEDSDLGTDKDDNSGKGKDCTSHSLDADSSENEDKEDDDVEPQ